MAFRRGGREQGGGVVHHAEHQRQDGARAVACRASICRSRIDLVGITTLDPFGPHGLQGPANLLTAGPCQAWLGHSHGGSNYPVIAAASGCGLDRFGDSLQGYLKRDGAGLPVGS